MTTTISTSNLVSPSFRQLVKNTFEIIQKIENFIPAYAIYINGKPLIDTSFEYVEAFLADSTYTPTLSFIIDTQYIDGQIVYTSLRRHIPEFREYIKYNESFAQISLQVPYEPIVGFEILWNDWLLYLSKIKLEALKVAA